MRGDAVLFWFPFNVTNYMHQLNEYAPTVFNMACRAFGKSCMGRA